MAFEKCPKCGTKGKIPVEIKTSRTTTAPGEEECDLCDGVGWIYEDATPLVLQELKEIKEILKQIFGGKEK
jgi:RecJ-like exonuclease